MKLTHHHAALASSAYLLGVATPNLMPAIEIFKLAMVALHDLALVDSFRFIAHAPQTCCRMASWYRNELPKDSAHIG